LHPTLSTLSTVLVAPVMTLTLMMPNKREKCDVMPHAHFQARNLARLTHTKTLDRRVETDIEAVPLAK
jgi:hypothetical protein